MSAQLLDESMSKEQLLEELIELREQLRRLKEERAPPVGCEGLERSSESLSDRLLKTEVDLKHFRSLAQQYNERIRELEAKNENHHHNTTTNSRPEPEGKEESKEVKRLKERLILVEEEYTREVLEVSEERDQLKERCLQLEEGLRAVEGKGAALRALETENKRLEVMVSSLEDKLEQSCTSVKNLQMVVEQIQKENERKSLSQRKSFEKRIEFLEQKNREMEEKLKKYQDDLKNREETFQAFQRLLVSEEQKERHLKELKSKIQALEAEVKAREAEVTSLREREDQKVDKSVLKGVLVQFLTSNERKPEIQRLLARILDFDETEMKRTGTQLTRELNSSESLSKSFVKFLELESKKPEVKSEPEVTRDLSRSLIQSTQRANPFLISRSSSSQSLNQSSDNLLIQTSFMLENQKMTSFVLKEPEREDKK